MSVSRRDWQRETLSVGRLSVVPADQEEGRRVGNPVRKLAPLLSAPKELDRRNIFTIMRIFAIRRKEKVNMIGSYH